LLDNKISIGFISQSWLEFFSVINEHVVVFDHIFCYNSFASGNNESQGSMVRNYHRKMDAIPFTTDRYGNTLGQGEHS